jgi:hypothetical protein
MRVVQQGMASWLALCVAAGGLVAISPVLHHWIEHGGHGPAHTHFKTRTETRGPKGNSHKQPTGGRTRLIHTHEGFKLPFAKVLSALLRPIGSLFVASSDSDSRPSPDNENHEHHSLPQLLASGSIELCNSFAEVGSFLNSSALRSHIPDVPLLEFRWDAQSASRGPPAPPS